MENRVDSLSTFELLTVPRLAKEFHVSIETVKAALDEGKLPFVVLSRRRYVPKAAIERFLAARD